jgi:hypothetical protein
MCILLCFRKHTNVATALSMSKPKMIDWLIETTNASLWPIRRGFAPRFVNYTKGCTRLATASDNVYQLLVRGRWFSPGTPASSITKTGRHDITEILLKVAWNTINQSIYVYVTYQWGHTIMSSCARYKKNENEEMFKSSVMKLSIKTSTSMIMF